MLLLAHPFEPLARIAGKSTTAAFVRATRPLHALASAPFALAFFVANNVVDALHAGYMKRRCIIGSCTSPSMSLYVVAGTLFWLPVLGPPPLRPLPYPARLFYLAVALPQGALVAMAIDSARSPLYAHYVATEGWRGALADQSNAAAVMWICGGLVVFTAFLTTLGVWAHRESERPLPS